MSINSRLSRLGVVLTAAAILSAPVFGQNFELFGGQAQVHGFFSQGFLKGSGNNYLTMPTNKGSFSMTDGGMNFSVRFKNKWRFGAQAYSRNIGQLGNGQVLLDWAIVEYRVNDWFGLRGGKVKTPLGLYNDTQDNEFLHTWALLPQSVYALDLRSVTIAHTGGDLFGEVSLKKAGRLSYQTYGGSRPDDLRGGYHYGLADRGSPLTGKMTGWVTGFDLKWATRVDGLSFGYSLMNGKNSGKGIVTAAQIPFSFETLTDHQRAYYGDFQRGRLHMSYEFRDISGTQQSIVFGAKSPESASGSTGWFAAASWKLLPKLEVGAYNSRFEYNSSSLNSTGKGANYIYDQVLNARYDIRPYWNVKVEGHFMDGFGSLAAAQGFYLRVNPGGLVQNTNLFVLRTGVSF